MPDDGGHAKDWPFFKDPRRLPLPIPRPPLPSASQWTTIPARKHRKNKNPGTGTPTHPIRTFHPNKTQFSCGKKLFRIMVPPMAHAGEEVTKGILVLRQGPFIDFYKAIGDWHTAHRYCTLASRSPSILASPLPHEKLEI